MMFNVSTMAYQICVLTFVLIFINICCIHAKTAVEIETEFLNEFPGETVPSKFRIRGISKHKMEAHCLKAFPKTGDKPSSIRKGEGEEPNAVDEPFIAKEKRVKFNHVQAGIKYVEVIPCEQPDEYIRESVIYNCINTLRKDRNGYLSFEGETCYPEWDHSSDHGYRNNPYSTQYYDTANNSTQNDYTQDKNTQDYSKLDNEIPWQGYYSVYRTTPINYLRYGSSNAYYPRYEPLGGGANPYYNNNRRQYEYDAGMNTDYSNITKKKWPQNFDDVGPHTKTLPDDTETETQTTKTLPNETEEITETIYISQLQSKSPKQIEIEFTQEYYGSKVPSGYRAEGAKKEKLQIHCQTAFGKKPITASKPFTVQEKKIKFNNVGASKKTVELIQCAQEDEFIRESVEYSNCIYLLRKGRDSYLYFESEKCFPECDSSSEDNGPPQFNYTLKGI